MAECVPDFAGPLGADAIGIFGSDRPAGGFDPGSLSPAARALYDRFVAAWAATPFASPSPSAGPSSGSTGWGSDAWPQPSSAASPGSSSGGDWTANGGNSASEEGLAGFTAGWALFSDVLPAVAESGNVTPDGVAAVARSLDLPPGSLPNGAGLRFSGDPATLGQNERAIGMVWQWQAVDQDVVVWPQAFATGTISRVPLRP